jgi:thiamine biosynthesis lipoprotein
VAASLEPRTRKTGPLASFFVALVLALLSGCADKPQSYSFAGETMGTSYQVTVIAAQAPPADLGDGIKAVLDNIDHKMSTYKIDSELSNLNAAAVGQPFSVSAELMEVLALSAIIYSDSNGAFDPTVGALVDLWGFGPHYREDQLPNREEIDNLLAKIGFDGIQLQPNVPAVIKTKDISLDLSAVAKGYAADKVGELLSAHGLSRYMVEVGGEMALSGVNMRNVPWQIAIERPLVSSRSVQRIVSLTDVGVATSGDYRNYFEKDGQRYSHTLDPRTGYPITHRLASVTVIADTSARADALATAFMVMGTEATLDYAAKEEIAVLTLSKAGEDFREQYSDAFKPYLNEVN